jgi:RNA polymerase sigma factor for flagellar operon FliA
MTSELRQSFTGGRVQIGRGEVLWAQYAETRDPAIREEIILQYAPLVKYVMGRMALSLPAILDSEDILSYGTIGLISAVDRFDPRLGVKFENYAFQRIRGAILDALRSLDMLPRGAARRARKLEDAFTRLYQEFGRPPSDDEVAEDLGISAADLQRALYDSAHAVVSLHSPLPGEDDGEPSLMIDLLEDKNQPDLAERVEEAELYQALVEAVRQLNQRDRTVLSLSYCEDLTLREISRVLNVSESRVSQIHTAALMKLRAALRQRQLGPGRLAYQPLKKSA